MTVPERFAEAINSGTDLISDSNDTWSLQVAYDQGLISDERMDEANVRLLTEMFALGLFDDKTYVDVDQAVEVTSDESFKEAAYDAHQKSVTLLKNKDNVLPLEKETKVYIEVFHKDPEKVEAFNQQALSAAEEKGLNIVDSYEEADAAILFLRPESGDYFHATDGYLELELVENKEKVSLKDGEVYEETTLSDIDRYHEIVKYMNDNNKKVITSLNFTLAWIVDSIEPNTDALIASFDTFETAQYDVIFGDFSPTGKLPLTLPASEEVIHVDENGVCVSPNDVPGYAKQNYMPEGMTYAYEDSEGNTYELDFGLTYDE